MKSIRVLSRVALLVGLGLAELVACSSDSRNTSTENLGVGSLQMPLQAVAASGHVYRLRNAVFQVTNFASGESSFLFSENDPNSVLLTAILNTGDYTVTLQPGWFMERLVSGGNNGGGGTGGVMGGGSAGAAGAFEEFPPPVSKGGGPSKGAGGSTGFLPIDIGSAGEEAIGGDPGSNGGSPGKAGAPGFGGTPAGGGTSVGGVVGEGGFVNAGGSVSLGGMVGLGGFISSGGIANGGAPGNGVFVEAQLISDAVQFFSIQSRSDSFVNYSFQIGGEVLQLNQGRINISIDVTEAEPQCDTPTDVTRSERVLLENDTAALGGVRLLDAFNAIASNGGQQSDGLRIYQEIYDSYATADQGILPDAVHCGDEVTDGQPTLNGYRIDCNRVEAQHVNDIDRFFLTSIVNRIDFTPANGANCGQQRMVFANPSRGRAFMILEAVVPNPAPELGVQGCLPLAKFWFEQNNVDDPFIRGQRLVNAFLKGDPELLAQGFGPFFTAENLTAGSGQIRTNQFDQDPWTLREFKLSLDGDQLRAIPFPTAEAPNGTLWDDTVALPQGEACRANFLTAMQGLFTDDLNQMSFVVDQQCRDAESRNDGAQAYAFRLSNGFRDTLNENLKGTGLSADDIANRAQFAGSCIGCHNEASGRSLGHGISAPFSNDFPQIEDFATSDCGARNLGTSCFQTSDALKTAFLPSRLNTLTNLLNVPIVPDPCDNGTGGSGGMGGKPSFGGSIGVGGVTGTSGSIGIGGRAGMVPGKDANRAAFSEARGLVLATAPAPRVQIRLPSVNTPIRELVRLDSAIRLQSGALTISGRSAQSTH
jgi:hypothetical protein